MTTVLTGLALLACLCCLLAKVVSEEWDKPSTWRKALSSLRSMTGDLFAIIVVFWGCASLLILGLADSAREYGNAYIEFETGLVQALETASSGRPEPKEVRGSLRDGSRYELVVDEAGPVVRIGGAGRAFCTRVLSDLSPYARSNLRVQDASGGWQPMGRPERACAPGAASRVSLSLRPAT